MLHQSKLWTSHRSRCTRAGSQVQAAMRMNWAIAVASCLILASVAVSAQEKPATSGQQSSTGTLYWSEKPDVKKWLAENEALLNQGDGCSLTSSWMNEEHPYPAGSVSEIASFVTVPGDDELTRVIHDPASGLDVRVGVRYAPGVPGQLYGLQVAIAFDGPPDSVFDEISRAEAETLRYPNWRSITVVKPVRVGNMRYRFSLRCENSRTFMNFLRRPAKKRHSDKPPQQ
jgi:hypothetical protein